MNRRSRPHILHISKVYYNLSSYGGDMASTWVAKPSVHVEVVKFLLNPVTTVIVANDDNYALAA